VFDSQQQNSQTAHKYKKIMKRLLKGNIALVLVLEEREHIFKKKICSKKVCVSNTHIFWDPEFADVKLWQTWVLCQELSKLVLTRNLPLILCGDFNSVPTSSVYKLLSMQRLPSNNFVAFRKDLLGILPSSNKMRHNLSLKSAYDSIGEPFCTNYTGHFVGVLDYIWYSTDHLKTISILDVHLGI